MQKDDLDRKSDPDSLELDEIIEEKGDDEELARKKEEQRESRESIMRREELSRDIEKGIDEDEEDEAIEDEKSGKPSEEPTPTADEEIEQTGGNFFERLKSLFSGDKIKEAFKAGSFAGVFKLFWRTITGEVAEEDLSKSIREEHEVRLKDFRELMFPYIRENKLPRGIKLELNDIGLLQGSGIDAVESLKRRLDELPTVDDYLEKHSIFKGKLSGSISLPRYLSIIDRTWKKGKLKARPEHKPRKVEEVPVEEAPVDERPEQVEVEPKSAFLQAPDRAIDFRRGSSCKFELDGEGHKEILIQRNFVIIGGKRFKMKALGIDSESFIGKVDADISFDKIIPKGGDAFQMDLIGKWGPSSQKKSAHLSSKDVIALMTSLEDNSGRSSFRSLVPVQGEGDVTFEFSRA